MPSQVRVNIDLETKKGNPEALAKLLNRQDVITKVNDFIVNVILDDEDTVEAAKYGGGAHVCFSYGDVCQHCGKSMSREWPSGWYVGDN